MGMSSGGLANGTREKEKAALIRKPGGRKIIAKRNQVTALGELKASFFAQLAQRHRRDFIRGDIDTGFIERHLTELVPSRNEPPSHVLKMAARTILAMRGRDADAGDPWNAQDWFRLSGEAHSTIEFQANDTRIVVPISHRPGGPMHVDVGGGNGRGDLDLDRKGGSVFFLSSGEIVVFEDGDAWTLSLYDPLAAEDSTGAMADRVVTPMPGKIIQVLVKAGDAVKKGQPLAVLEAMKMEHTLSASGDATVEAVDVAPGDQVSDGATVVRFAHKDK